jgi:hypothetical protein
MRQDGQHLSGIPDAPTDPATCPISAGSKLPPAQ